MPKRIGIDPFEGVIPRSGEQKKAKPEPAVSMEVPKRRRRKERLTVQIDRSVIDLARDAVYWTPGLTLAALVEDAILRHVKRMEKRRDGPFPERKKELKAGRPLS